MRSLYNYFLIDGKPILTPDAGMELSREDLDSAESGRDESGVMHRFVLRYGVRKWSPSYAVLTEEEYVYMLSLIQGKSEFRVTYRDETGTRKSGVAYCSKTSILLYDQKAGLYKNFKLNIIEC